MRAMRSSLIAALAALLFVSPHVRPAAPAPERADPIELTRRIAQAGAADLALARIDELQPRDSAAPGWVEWEALRIALLGERGRHDDALKRAAALSRGELPARIARGVWANAARSAVKLGQGTTARAFLGRLLWQADLPPAEYRDARMAVVESYLAERDIDSAYRSMLRFQQDFNPLARPEAARFVDALLDHDRAREAAGWLAQLDPASAAAARLRLRAGLISPEAAVAQARILTAKGADPGGWDLLLAAAVAQKNRALEIEALEQRLQHADERSSVPVAQAGMLWRAYVDAAQAFANQAQLLAGDDAGWADRASRLLGTQPQIARALFGYLAVSGRTPDSRRISQLQLVVSLAEAKLDLAALRLFSDAERFPVANLDAHARYRLGAISADRRQHAAALRFWDGLAPPAGVSPEQWQVRNIEAFFRAGRPDPGLERARGLVAGQRSLAPETLRGLTLVAAEALDTGQAKASEALLTLILPFAEARERVEVLRGMGRAREASGGFRAAAEAFVEAAITSTSPESDPSALRLREAAAANLARAGLRDDARALYEWLAKNAKDAAVRDQAVRELRRQN